MASSRWRHTAVVSAAWAAALVLTNAGALAAEDSRAAFFAALSAQCGARFEGASTFPTDPTHDFAGKRLQAHIRDCAPGRLAIPFTVGEDRSRTWLLRWDGEQLRWHHDHRHADGSPDEVTMYGGQADGNGNVLQQSFPADAYTAQLLPAATSNVWTVTLSADGQTLIYHLARNGQPRYEAVLHRVSP